MLIEDLDTPFLTVDLDAVERNIARLQTYCNEHGLANRPHIKTHKLPALAHNQVHAGAVGITCQKLGEAEVMAQAGLDDIFISYPLVGESKAERLAHLAREVRMSTAADSAYVARCLSQVLAREGVEVDFLVDCDTGYQRTGVQSPEAAADLAELAESLPGLRFAGLMTYPTRPESGPWLASAREAIERRGLQVDRISGGGTPAAFRTHEIEGITELRAGTYIYGDRACIANGSVPQDDCALRVRATVVSRPTRDRAILDGGSKTFSSDVPQFASSAGYGLIVEYPDAVISRLTEEHGHVEVGLHTDGLEIGEVVTVIPNHACATTNLHDNVAAHRGGRVVGIWPIPARGKLR
jgi:D-serine deaminase-like pyridoxal phosphate-dependent protein